MASETGGTYLHNSNDLERGLKRLTLAPEYSYQLEFSPKGVKEDRRVHTLKAKVDVKGAKVRARGGYIAEQIGKEKGVQNSGATSPVHELVNSVPVSAFGIGGRETV